MAEYATPSLPCLVSPVSQATAMAISCGSSRRRKSASSRPFSRRLAVAAILVETAVASASKVMESACPHDSWTTEVQLKCPASSRKRTPCLSVVADRSTLDFRMDLAQRPILLGRGDDPNWHCTGEPAIALCLVHQRRTHGRIVVDDLAVEAI